MRRGSILGGLITVILIILVVLGIKVIMDNVSDEEGTEKKQQTAQEAFNGKFEIYEGEQTGEELQKLVSEIKSNNGNLVSSNYRTIKVSENGYEIAGTIIEYNIEPKNIYTITFYYDEEGYINKVDIVGIFKR